MLMSIEFSPKDFNHNSVRKFDPLAPYSSQIIANFLD